MTTQKTLDFATAILRCMEADNKSDACLATAELIRQLKEEIAFDAAKKSGKTGEKQRTAAAKKFLSYISSRLDDMRCAFTMREEDLPFSLSDYIGKHGLINGAAVIVTEPIIGLPEPANAESNPKMFNSALSQFQNLNMENPVPFDPASVSLHISNAKAEAKAPGWKTCPKEYRTMKFKEYLTMKFTLQNGKAYGLNAELLSSLITMLGGKDIEISFPSEEPNKPCKLQSPLGVAYLLPVWV